MNRLGDVITVARKARGLTQAELGDRLSVSQVAINRYEAGMREPDEATVTALSRELRVTEELLRHGAKFTGALAVDAHMRRQRTTKASLWRHLEARLNLMRLHSSLLFEQVSMSAEHTIPTFDFVDTAPETAARLTRAQWRMPIGPVVNLTRWLESAGCLVFEEDFGTPRIDGLSQWVGDHPVMLINSSLTASRRRLTLAHELGHLVLHSNGQDEDAEDHANRFAAEFMAPEHVIRPELRRTDIPTLIELKREWGLSMQTIFERAFYLGMANADARTSFYKAMNARGWKTNEPAEDAVAMEHPKLAQHIAIALAARGFSDTEIATTAGFGEPSESPFRTAPPRLRVVSQAAK